MPTPTTRRILARLPDGYFSKDEPELREEYSVTNGSFEAAGATADKAADWARSTNAGAVFEADPTTQGRLLVGLADPGSSDPLQPILRGSYAYVLGEKAATKPARTVASAEFVQVQSSMVFETKDFTHIAFRHAYISETDWSVVGVWKGELLVDGTVRWDVDLHSGQTVYNSNQEVDVSALGPGYHTIVFRLRKAAAGSYTGRLPTFLLDDVRMVNRRVQDPTVIWMVLYGIALSFARWHVARRWLKDMLRIARAYGSDLDALGKDYGVGRPGSLALSDVQYRDLIRLCLFEPKTTRKAITDVIEVLTGATPTFTMEGPSGGNPPILTITLTQAATITSDKNQLTDLWFYG